MRLEISVNSTSKVPVIVSLRYREIATRRGHLVGQWHPFPVSLFIMISAFCVKEAIMSGTPALLKLLVSCLRCFFPLYFRCLSPFLIKYMHGFSFFFFLFHRDVTYCIINFRINVLLLVLWADLIK